MFLDGYKPKIKIKNGNSYILVYFFISKITVCALCRIKRTTRICIDPKIKY